VLHGCLAPTGTLTAHAASVPSIESPSQNVQGSALLEAVTSEFKAGRSGLRLADRSVYWTSGVPLRHFGKLVNIHGYFINDIWTPTVHATRRWGVKKPVALTPFDNMTAEKEHTLSDTIASSTFKMQYTPSDNVDGMENSPPITITDSHELERKPMIHSKSHSLFNRSLSPSILSTTWLHCTQPQSHVFLLLGILSL